MPTVIILNDSGEEQHRSRVDGVDTKLLAATITTAIARMPAPRKPRSDKGIPKGPRATPEPPRNGSNLALS